MGGSSTLEGRRFRAEVLGTAALVVAVMLALALAPAAAQADPVTTEGCTAQLQVTGDQPPEPTLEFTIVCENEAIVGTTFRTTQGAVIPGFQAENANPEENPLQGLTCVPPAGEEFNCGGRLEAGTIGRAEIGTQEDPCVTGFEIEDLTLDTDPEPAPGSEPPVPDEEDVVFNQAIPLQGCVEQPPPDEEPDDGGGGESNDCEAQQSTSGDSGDRETGDFESEDTRETESSGNDCPPEGGVDAGFGGNVKSGAGNASAGGLPMMPIGGASLVILGLLAGGLTLARRP